MNTQLPQASGQRLIVQGGRVLNVYTGELLEEDIFIEQGRIVATVPAGRRGNGGARGARGAESTQSAVWANVDVDAAEVVDVSGQIVVPGYVEPHAHLGLMAEPVATLEQMALTGTTTVVADTYAFMVTLSDDDLVRLLDKMQQLPTVVRWFLAPHARSFLLDEEQQFAVERLEKLLPREDIVALGELTRWPAVEQGDPDLLDKIRRGLRAGKRIEGHGAGASPPRLQRLVRHGVTSDHEAITAEQVMDRLRMGFYTMLRHSSLRPDLPVLTEAIAGELAHSNRIMLTVDGPTPIWMDEHGYLDNLIRICMERGIAPAAAYRMATLNPAMYYGLEHDVGGIAPGRRADLNVLNDLSDPTPILVMAAGRVIAEQGRLTEPFPTIPWQQFAGMNRPQGKAPRAALFEFDVATSDEGSTIREGDILPGDVRPGDNRNGGGDAALIPTLELSHTVLLRHVEPDPAATRVAVYDWDGRWMTRAFVRGFAERLGGLATSYSPAYQVTVFGHNADDMAIAATRVMERKGGMCLVEDGEVVWEMPLERAGLFTEMPWGELVATLTKFEELMRERGYRHHELLYSMFFFGFDSLPDFRLTVRGVWDVRQHKVLAPPLRLQ